jgi:DNA end-binding protein Ku
MTARAIGSGTISFGLVSVPVKLYSAGDSTAALSFNWIHKDCGSRLKQQYICAREGTVVERDDMVKGYEFSKDQYVLFNVDELKALEVKADNTIEIVEFVPASKVDRVFVDKPYYLGPDKGGDRAYRLLSEAMQATQLSALGRYAARGKQYLVLLSPRGDGIVMEQLRYSHEVRSFEEVPLGQADIKPKELDLAVQLIQQVATDEFRPDQYKDDVRERVLELIQKKIEGEDITQTTTEAPQTQIIDLMEALKASLARSGPAPAKTGQAGVTVGSIGPDDGKETKPARKKAPLKKEVAKKEASPRRKAAGGSK